jgi:hypothetical protein
MKRGFVTVCLGIALSCLLTGCLFKGADQLYTLPKLSADYTNLQDVLERYVDNGLEYAAPKSGDNTQAVQFRDLNGDGEDEVIAFFRDSSGAKPLKIDIFQRTEDDLYVLQNEIEGDGTAFHSIAYVDLNGVGSPELVVNYQISDLVYALSVYSLDGGGVTRLLQAGCTRYAVGDLNDDGVSELMLLQQDNSEEGGNRAEWYLWQDDALEEGASVSLSAGITGIKRVRTSKLAGGELAIYVTGTYGEAGDQLITDILAVRKGTLCNITLDEETGISTSSLRRNTDEDIFATDLNGDGIFEIPFATELNELGGSNVWSVDWIQYRLNGSQIRVCTTICSPKDDWYLTITEEQRGNLWAVRTESAVTEEVSVALYDSTEPIEEEETPEPWLTISVLSGANRVPHSKQGERFVLSRGSEEIYAASLSENRWNVSQEDVTQAFHFMPSNWSSTD